MPNNYRRELTKLSDAELIEKWCDVNAPLSEYSSQVFEEMQRRALDKQLNAQIASAQASKEAADAAKKYTKATWALIVVTAIGILLSAFFQAKAAYWSASTNIKTELVTSSELDHPLTSSQQRLDSVPSGVKPDRQCAGGGVAAAKPE